MVDVVRAAEDEVVGRNAPVVGFTVTDKQNFGMVGVNVVEQGHLLEGVVDVFLASFV